jgi:hypothetical protein
MKWACNPINLHLYWIHLTGTAGDELRENGPLPGVNRSREQDLAVSC